MPNKKPVLWQIITAIIAILAVGIGLLINLTRWDVIDLIYALHRNLIPEQSESYTKFLFEIMTEELEQFPQKLSDEVVEEDGIVSILHGTIFEETSSLFDNFVANTSNGKAAQIIIAGYTAEGSPIYKNVFYDGVQYFAVIDISRDRFVGEGEDNIKIHYDYLKIITHPETGSKFVILTNDNGLTFEKLRDAQIGSNMESIDSYQLFSYSE